MESGMEREGREEERMRKKEIERGMMKGERQHRGPSGAKKGKAKQFPSAYEPAIPKSEIILEQYSTSSKIPPHQIPPPPPIHTYTYYPHALYTCTKRAKQREQGRRDGRETPSLPLALALR